MKDLSRFGRNYIEFGQYTDYLFPPIGCRFIALGNGIDTGNNDSSTDVMCFLNLINEFYSRDTSKKVKDVKPFTMYGIASLFFFVIFKAFIMPDLATEYLAGAALLGVAPCTAMVFVWSALTKGNPAYAVVLVATNNLIILVAFMPIVKFLFGVSNVAVPWDTLILSVVLFVVIPLAGGMLTRSIVTKRKGKDYFENIFVQKFDGITTIGLSHPKAAL